MASWSLRRKELEAADLSPTQVAQLVPRRQSTDFIHYPGSLSLLRFQRKLLRKEFMWG